MSIVTKKSQFTLYPYLSSIPLNSTAPPLVRSKKAYYRGSEASCSANDRNPGVPSPIPHLPLNCPLFPHRSSLHVQTTPPPETHDSKRHKLPDLPHNTRAEICSFFADTVRAENRDITANSAKYNTSNHPNISRGVSCVIYMSIPTIPHFP